MPTVNWTIAVGQSIHCRHFIIHAGVIEVAFN